MPRFCVPLQNKDEILAGFLKSAFQGVHFLYSSLTKPLVKFLN